MTERIIECVPNFSEGRDMGIIRQITDVIESVNGVRLLNVDPGMATNRTVVTFVGDPVAVSQAAFLAVKKASEVIICRNIMVNIPGWERQMSALLCRFPG